MSDKSLEFFSKIKWGKCHSIKHKYPFFPKGLVVPRYTPVEDSWRQAHTLYFKLLSDFYNILILFIFEINLHK